MSDMYRNPLERGHFVWRVKPVEPPAARRRRPSPRPRPLRWLMAFLIVAAASGVERGAVLCAAENQVVRATK